MALTVPRWIAAAVAGSLMLGAYFLRPVGEHGRPTDEQQRLQERRRRANSDGSRAAERLYVLRLRDSLLAKMPRAGASDSSRAFYGAGLEVRHRNALRSFVVRLALSRPAHAKVPVDLVFVLDDMSRVRGITRDYQGPAYLLPTSGNPRCVVLSSRQNRSGYGYGNLNPYSYSLSAAGEFIGPCAYYERFGVPGQSVDRWLRSGGWSFGAVGAWSLPDAPWKPWWWEYESMTGLRAAGWPLRDHIGMSGFRCVSGDTGRCKDIVTGATNDLAVRPSRITWSSGIVSGRYRQYYDRVVLGPNQDALLAEMVRTLGPDRFQEFWSSPLPPAEAFRAATGQDIGAWTLNWARRMYGEQARGPGLSGLAAGVGILVALAALGAAMAAAQRRQVA